MLGKIYLWNGTAPRLRLNLVMFLSIELLPCNCPMQRWYPSDIRCRLFPEKELPAKYHAGFNSVLLALKRKTPFSRDQVVRAGEIAFFPFKEWTLYPLMMVLINGLFIPIFLGGIVLTSSSESGVNSFALNLLICFLLLTIFLFLKNLRTWWKMRGRKSCQPFGMYVFPDAVILRYPPKFVYRKLAFGSCRYFPRSGVSEVIIDENLMGGYDEPVKRKYWPQLYFNYLSGIWTKQVFLK